MLNPSIGKLIDKENNRYRLVLRIAKEARHITQTAHDEGEIIVEKPVTLAMDKVVREMENAE